jgi:hypothetical protein
MAANDSNQPSEAPTTTDGGAQLDTKLKIDARVQSKSVTEKLKVEHADHLRVYDNGGVMRSEESNVEGSIKVKAGKDSISGSAGEKETNRSGLTYDTQGTHMVVSGDVATWVEGSIKTLGYGYSGKLEGGKQETYEVVVPPPYKVDPGTINPFNLTDLPTGTILKLDSTKYGNEESAVKFGKQLGGVEIGGGYKDSNTVNVTLEKAGENIVRVTVNAKDTIHDTSRIGEKLGPVTPQIGRDGEMAVSTTTTAEFDLSTPSGREAYGRFIVERELPQRDGDGVSKVSTVQQMEMDSQPRVGLKGIAAADAGLHVHQTYIYNKSGDRADITFTYDVKDAISAQSTYPLGKDGQPDLSQGKQFSIKLPHVEHEQAASLRTAFGGEKGSRGLDGDQAVELKFTSEQLMQMRERARDYLNHQRGPGLLGDVEAGKSVGLSAEDMQLVAIATAKNPGEVYNALLIQDGKFLAGNMTRLDVGLPDPKPSLPGSLGIDPPAAMAAKMASMEEVDREALMNKFYRAPASHVQNLEKERVAPNESAPTAGYSRTSTEKAPHLNDAGHPDRALYAQALAGVRQLDATLGRTPDESTERVAASLVVASRRDGLAQIDHVILSPDGGQIYAVQGELNSPLKRIADVDTAQAVQTPIAQSSTAWSQAVQAKLHEPVAQTPVAAQAGPQL